jgi:hypothetical protein
MKKAEPDNLEPVAARGRGRPKTGNAVPGKVRQEAHRARLEAAGKVRVGLIVGAEVRDQLDELQAWSGLSRDEVAELAIGEKHRRLSATHGAKKDPRRTK